MDYAHARRARMGLFLLTLLWGAYFFGGASSNQNARLDAIYGFVEPGTMDTGSFRINHFMVTPTRSINTLDWATYEGNYYANKAPGTIWLGAFTYQLLWHVESLFGVDQEAPAWVIGNAYAINLFVSVVPLALGALALFELALAFGLTVGRASAIAIAGSLGTLWFPYSTQLWGHTTAAALVLVALWQIQRNTARASLLAGACLGLAVCTDYFALLAALAVGSLLLWTRPRQVPVLLLGALPLALALMGYHTMCFGSPFVTASQMSNPAFLEQDRALGMFGSLSWHAVWELSFGLARGLFIQCPILILSLVGFAQWIWREPHRPLPWLCLGASLAYLAANASFNGWHGGATVGARYLICALPFLALGLCGLTWSRPASWAFGVLLTWSLINMLVIAAVNPVAPDELTNPLYDYSYGLFVDGQLSPYPFGLKLLMLRPDWKEWSEFAMWNLGELLGLNGLWSLLPLVLASALIALIWRRSPMSPQAERPSPTVTG